MFLFLREYIYIWLRYGREIQRHDNVKEIMLLKDELAVGCVKGCILDLMSLLVAILLPIAMDVSIAVHIFLF